jgi:hypothetical protein
MEYKRLKHIIFPAVACTASMKKENQRWRRERGI